MAEENISVVLKKDAQGNPIPGTDDGALIRIRLFDDRERVLFFKVPISTNWLILPGKFKSNSKRSMCNDWG